MVTRKERKNIMEKGNDNPTAMMTTPKMLSRPSFRNHTKRGINKTIKKNSMSNDRLSARIDNRLNANDDT